MSVDIFGDWLVRSLITGAVAVILTRLCPASWRGRFRLVVPVAAFTAFLALGFWLLGPLPRLEIAAPASVAAATNLPLNPGAWAVGLWITGVLAFLIRQAWGVRAIARLIRDTRPVPGREWRQLMRECHEQLGLRRIARLRLAGPGFVPSATGLFRPTVLLPDEALGWTEEQRRLVLLHELGHFQRGDLWIDALSRIACALHWFNPFAWLLQRQLAVEREYACDALVVEQGAKPRDYAMLLWEMASATRRRPAAASAFLTMAAPQMGKLELRVRRILESGRKSGNWLRLADGILCAILATSLVACTACKPVVRMLTGNSSQWTPAEVRARLQADPFPG